MAASLPQPRGRAPTILQVVPTLVSGGVERTAIDVARAIVAAGGRAIVASEGGPLATDLTAAGGELVVIPGIGSKNPLKLPANIAALKRVMQAEGVDIVHARSRAPAWAALFAARALKVPFITTQAGAHGQSNALKALYNSVMARGDVVIANSNWTKALVESRFPFAKGKVIAIPRGTDLSEFDRGAIGPERIAALRAAWGVSADTPIILKLARVTRWKGQHVLIDAVARLAARGECDFTVILAGATQGSGAYADELRAQIAAAGLSDRVKLVGHCADPAAAMATVRVAVVASIEPEAFGRAATEAQALGTPVIVSDLGAVPETVLAPPDVAASARTGWRVPAGDADALADALEGVLALDEADRSALAARARAHVEQHFSLQAMTGATLDVYRRVLGWF